MAGTTFQELLDGVAAYYGSGSDQWAEIARYGVNQQTLPIIEQVPGVNVTVSDSGRYLGYDYNNPFAVTTNPVSVIDSNVQTGAYGAGAFNAQLPGTVITNPSTGTTTMQSGARTISTSSTVATVADKIGLGVAGVALGTKLGKLIDSAIYSIDPEWWDEHYPSINPQTWANMATTEGGKSAIRALFGIADDSATMYLDENMLAYTYMMLLQAGAYSDGAGQATYNPPPGIDVSGYTQPLILLPPSTHFTLQGTSGIYREFYGFTCEYIACLQKTGSMTIYGVSHTPFSWYEKLSATGSPVSHNSIQATTLNGTPYYFSNIYPSPQYFYGGFEHYGIPYNLYQGSSGDWNVKAGTIIIDGVVSGGSTLDGVEDNPDASEYINPNTLINPTTGNPVTPNDNPSDVTQALQTQYPNLFNNSIYVDVPQPDGTTQRITYIPVPYPNTTNINQPITQVNPGVNPQVYPEVTQETYPETVTQELSDSITETPTPPDTGEGDTPAATIPTGSASALYSIYNPTQGELNSFGAWLWSSNFVDQLLKLFNDPMQAIIGLHKVFAPPPISGTSTIKVGYLDSGVSSNVVGSQYTTIDCGSVNLSEYFGNVFDYDPFTQVYIYLPFVGIEKLDTGDVMRGNIGVKYHVDVITGACLAEISVTRDGAGGILYTFAGNCAVQYPISSGSYMGIVASLASIAGGVVGTIASGGALAPVAMGAVSGVMNAHTRVNHSGAFSGNAGAMGVKNPYLIITRPQTCLADNFPEFNGYPANKTTTISACSGFVKCETCHVENIPATNAELSEIEMLLKSGVLV